MRLTIHENGEVVITLPKGISEKTALRFYKKNEELVLRKREKLFKENRNVTRIVTKKDDYRRKKNLARKVIGERLKYFCDKYGFEFNGFTVRNQKSRWGSCSSLRNLNFNYRLIYLSKKQMDYIIVHELCHLREMNHSKKFWEQVEKIIPEYLEIRRELKNIRY